MRTFFTILALVICQYSLKASDLLIHYDSVYQQANTHYQNGNFNDAIAAYTMILKSGYEAPDLYYNLGNGYYKINENTKAILYYEKALKLKPNDADYLYNLSLANKKIVDKVTALPEPFYQVWWNELIFSFSLNTWTILFLISFSLTAGCMVLFLTSQKETTKRILFFFVIIVGVSSLASGLFATVQKKKLFSQEHAIIFATRTPVYSSPNSTSTQLFVLHSGLKVTVLEKDNNWANVLLTDGNKGWIPVEAIRDI